MSATALLDVAENVFAIDASDEMLKLALTPQQIKYSRAFAENLPLKIIFLTS